MTVPAGVFRKGQAGFVTPGSPEHSAAITPSKVAAILGISRWESPYRLWHRMKGLAEPEPAKDMFQIGHDLEPFAANRWRHKNPGWRISPGEVQFIHPPEKFGFPVICTLDRRASRGSMRRAVEFKCARTLADVEQWGDDLTGDAPEDYTSQVLAQMIFTGWTEHPGHLLAVGPYYNDRVYVVDYDPDVATWILEQCRVFYESLAGDTPPELDDSVATYQCVRELHPDIDGTTVEIDPELAMAVHNANANAKAADTELRGLKTQLLDAMGNAQHAVLGDLKIADRRTHAKGGVALNLARTHPAVQAEQRKATA